MKTALVTTGAEAVENAVKFARAYTGRSDVIAFHGGFHGRTLLGMALTGKVLPYKAKFGPMPAGIWHVPFPVAHKGITVEDSIHAIELLFKCDVEPQRVAAIIIEPVQGEGGFYIAPKELMVRLRKLCDEHGILLIADEIQSGFGRTGKFFAMEHFGVEPDLMTAAKSLAGGFPLAAVIGRPRSWTRQSPAASAAPMPAMRLPARPHLACSRPSKTETCWPSREAGRDHHEAPHRHQGQRQGHADGRCAGLGAMCAFELVTKHGGTEPDAGGAKALAAKCLERGLLILTCGVYGDVVRLLTPLTASEMVLNEGLDILESAILGN